MGWGFPKEVMFELGSEKEFRGVLGEERRRAWLDLDSEGKKGVQARPRDHVKDTVFSLRWTGVGEVFQKDLSRP